MIREAAIKTKGTAGPSGQDADQWRRILNSKNYGKYNSDLREAMARMLKILCRQEVDVERRPIEAVLAYRLIPLDKNPGIRPIKIGAVMRRIFGKVLINTIKPDILKQLVVFKCALDSRRAVKRQFTQSTNSLKKMRQTE